MMRWTTASCRAVEMAGRSEFSPGRGRRRRLRGTIRPLGTQEKLSEEIGVCRWVEGVTRRAKVRRMRASEPKPVELCTVRIRSGFDRSTMEERNPPSGVVVVVNKSVCAVIRFGSSAASRCPFDRVDGDCMHKYRVERTRKSWSRGDRGMHARVILPSPIVSAGPTRFIGSRELIALHHFSGQAARTWAWA